LARGKIGRRRRRRRRRREKEREKKKVGKRKSLNF